MNIMTALSTEKPIFVCGVPKSGTTLVGQLLSNHPDVSIDYDVNATVPFLRYVQAMQSDFFFFSDIPTTPMGRQDAYWRKDGFRAWNLLNIEYFQGLHQSYSRHGVHRWGSSTCFSHVFRHTLWKWFPQAQFFVVMRDPRDHWCSFKYLHMPKYPDRWNNFVRCVGELPGKGEDPRIKFVEYHEVVKNPTLVYDLLGLETPENYLDGVLEIFLGRTLGREPKEWVDDLREGKKLMTSRVGRWKRDLSEEEVQRCTEVFPETCEYYDDLVTT